MNTYSKIITFAKILFAFLISKLPFGNRNYWMILERGKDAQDNAWHFMKYMNKQQPNEKIRYAIRKNSPDYEKNLKDYKSIVVQYDSLQYYILLYRSKFIVSTHYRTFIPIPSIAIRIENSFLRLPAKLVYLEHGIVHNELPSFIYPSMKVDLFTCGTMPEYELMCSKFGHPEGVMKYTGLARFDNLFDNNVKRQILIMPTWRIKYRNYTFDQFKETDFFQAYSKLLSDERILSYLKEKNYKILYYNHIEFQKFNPCFEDFASENVEIIKFGQMTVQDMMKESAALVTDYSSVYYDFIYMAKPILFFQLNKAEFLKNQYGVDYDNVEDFGYVTYDTEATIIQILDMLEKDCIMQDKYREHMKKVYPLHDNKNRQRIYEEILKLG